MSAASGNLVFMAITAIKDLIEGSPPSNRGFWKDRPIDDTGKQVEERDIIALRCVLKNSDFLFGAAAAFASRVEGLGDPKDIKGEGYWLSTRDKDGDGGNWCCVVDGKIDKAMEFIVRKHDFKFFELEIRHKWAFVTHSGHWINGYKYKYTDDDGNDGSPRHITFSPTSNGYAMKFADSNAEVLSHEYLNVKGWGQQVSFIPVHTGRAEGDEFYSPDSNDGIGSGSGGGNKYPEDEQNSAPAKPDKPMDPKQAEPDKPLDPAALFGVLTNF